MECLRRVEEKGRCSGRGEAGGNLAAHMTGLAHTGDNYPALCGKNCLYGGNKFIINAGSQLFYSSGLHINCFYCFFLNGVFHGTSPIFSEFTRPDAF